MELALLPAYLWIVCSALAALAGAVRLNESLYTLTAADTAPAAALIARLDALLPRIGLRTVLGDATAQPQPAADYMLDSPYVVKGWRWSAHDPPDESSTTWEPQGISTAADTGFARDIADGNSDVLVVSWNDVRNATGTATEPGLGVRVSFVRQGTADGAPSNRAYAHVLLVEPVADSAGSEPSFRALANVISGGVVWRRNWLFVPDRDRGLRVFDTNYIWRVRSGATTIGRSGSDFYGGEHALVMPQTRLYTLGNKTSFRPHAASLDRNSTPPAIMLGEATGAGINSTILRFRLDAATDLLAANNASGHVASAMWAWKTNLDNVQGIAFSPEGYFVSLNDGNNVRGDLLRWQPGSWAAEFHETFPPGVQSLAYRPTGDELWAVGSVPGARYVMALNGGLKNSTARAPTPAGTGNTLSATAPPRAGGDGGGGGKRPPSQIAGITLGVLAATGGTLAGVLVCLRRRHAAATAAALAEAGDAESASDQPELMDPGSDKARTELCTSASTVEADAAVAAVEVEAGRGSWPAGAGEMSTDPPDRNEMPATLPPEWHEIGGGTK